MHIHVGHNMPGYLPESTPMCFGSESDALDALKHELRDQQGYYWEQCMSECDRTHPYEECTCGNDCECGWCNVAGDVEAALSAISDGDALPSEGRAGWIFNPPEGASIHHWAVLIPGDRDKCDCNPDSDSYIGD